jgi:hypothetical protein
MRLLLVILLTSVLGCGETRSPFASQPVSAATTERACAMLNSCWPSSWYGSVSSCVSSYETALLLGPAGVELELGFGPMPHDQARLIDCAGHASSCADTLSCLGSVDASWCDSHTLPTCVGDTVVTCQGGAPLSRRDCGALGMRCVTESDGGGVCSDGKSCTTSGCDDGHLVSCVDGLEQRYDCAAYLPGSRCDVQKGADGTTIRGCIGPGTASCAVADSSSSCDGDELTICREGSTIHVACTQVARHCGPAGTDGSDCLPDGSDCDGTSDSCQGDVMQVCVDGKWMSTPCSSLGFSSCSTTTITNLDGTSGLQARCS